MDNIMADIIDIVAHSTFTCTHFLFLSSYNIDTES